MVYVMTSWPVVCSAFFAGTFWRKRIILLFWRVRWKLIFLIDNVSQSRILTLSSLSLYISLHYVTCIYVLFSINVCPEMYIYSDLGYLKEKRYILMYCQYYYYYYYLNSYITMHEIPIQCFFKIFLRLCQYYIIYFRKFLEKGLLFLEEFLYLILCIIE